MSLPSVAIRRTEGADHHIPLPAYQTAGAAGMDVRANLPAAIRAEGVTLQPGGRAAIPAGFAIALPDGFEMQVRARSGLALKEGVIVANGPGTIDADYRGEVGIILLNAADQPFTVTHGARIAQLVVAPVVHAVLEEVNHLPQTQRGAGGFGSTGR